jgi:hypothetical protein
MTTTCRGGEANSALRSGAAGTTVSWSPRRCRWPGGERRRPAPPSAPSAPSAPRVPRPWFHGLSCPVAATGSSPVDASSPSTATPATTIAGVLGEQPVDAAVQRARDIAAGYDGVSPELVVPTFEIITTVASVEAGPDGDYSMESALDHIRPWVDAAAAAGFYVVLDSPVTPTSLHSTIAGQGSSRIPTMSPAVQRDRTSQEALRSPWRPGPNLRTSAGMYWSSYTRTGTSTWVRLNPAEFWMT